MLFKFSPRKFSLFCWQILASALVLLALVISLFRALLPQLDQIRAELVSHIASEYQVQVDAGELTARWQALGPELTIGQLTIPSQERLPFTLLIDNVHVKFDFWQSIISMRPQITRVIFDNVQVALDVDKLSYISSQSMDKQTADTDWIYQLLLEQLKHFSIRNASLQLLSVKQQYKPIYVKDLTWRNSKLRHQGQGKVYLDEAASEFELLNLRLDIVGSGYKPDSLQGQVYLAARSLDLGRWASRQVNPYDSNKKLALEGVINLEAWFDIGQRSITSAQVELEPSWLEWQLNEHKQHFEVEGGRMLWFAEDKGWRLTSQDLVFNTNQKAWPKLELTAEKRNQVLITSLNRLDTSTLLPLLPLIPTVDLDVLKKWQLLEPKGYINDIKLSDDEQNGLQLAFDIAQLSWQNKAQIPGVSPFDMHVGWKGNHFFFSLPKQKYEVDFGSAFKQSLVFDGEVLNAKYDVKSQALVLPSIELNNSDISIEASMRLSLLNAANLALLADVKFHDVSKAVNYFPLDGMSQELVEYLETGLVAGEIQDAKVLYNGALSGYPYQDHSGIFQAEFTLEEAEFEFQPDWPSVTGLNLSAMFENARMDLLINKGKLLDVVVDGANIVIPQLGERSLLQINADLLTQGESATQVLNRSPLADPVGSTLNVVQIQGSVGAKLDLDIPLYEGEKERIHGVVNFDKTPVYITEPGIALGEVTGEVEFLDDVVTGKGIEATLFQQAVSLNVNTGSVGDDYGLELQLNGTWALEKLPDDFDNPLKNVYSGELNWEGAMSMIFSPKGYQIQAQISSDLLGVNLDLPHHFAKDENQLRPLNVEFTGDNKQSSLGITLGQDIEFLAGFNEESGDQLAYFDLILGRLFTPDDPINQDKGHLQLSIEETRFTPWLAIINQFTQPEQSTVRDIAGGNESINIFPPLISIDGNISHLDLMGQSLTNLNINAHPIDDVWSFEAKSDEFDGRVDFYPDWSTQGLKLVASKLHLSPVIKKPENALFKSHTVLKNLPPLAIDVDEFSLYDKPLGHLVLQGTPQGDNYHIQTVSLTTPDVTFVGNGAWNNSGNENLTEFNVKLDAAKFDDLSAILGMDPGLKDAPLAINGQVSWQGAPYAFSLGSLNGLVDFKLGKGHLSEVSDKGARIFSLFSLDSLLRKLSLDFSDVFGKGLYFDSFTGTLDIDHGVIKTHNTEMDAVAGNMKVRGYTDLMTESLNYDISFVPQLASSVPTVVLLTTGGWTFGLGAFALTKVLEPVIEVITELKFRLTGTMSAPKLEELTRKSKEIVIPESVLEKVNKEAVDVTEKKLEKSDKIRQLNSLEQSLPSSGVELPESNVKEIPIFKDNVKKEVKNAD